MWNDIDMAMVRSTAVDEGLNGWTVFIDATLMRYLMPVTPPQ